MELRLKLLASSCFPERILALNTISTWLWCKYGPTSVVNNLLNSFWRQYTATGVSIIFFSWRPRQVLHIHQRFEDQLRLHHHGYDVTYSVLSLSKLHSYSHRASFHTILCFRAEIGLRNSRLTETSDQAVIPREIYCVVTVEASV